MRQNMHDTVSIPNKVGYLDIFLTVTFNPLCLEINNTFLPVLSFMGRPDISACDFHSKLRALMAFIID